MRIDQVITQDLKKIKKSKVVTGEFIPEFVVKTKGRLRLGDITLAKDQTLVVSINRGYDGKRNIGYFFMHNGKRFNMAKKDVEVISGYRG